MALLCTTDKTVLLACNRDVTFIDSLGSKIFKLTLPKYAAQKAKQAEDNDDDEQIEEDQLKKKTNASEESSRIQHIAVSPNEKLLVITTSGDKLIYMYKMLAANEPELMSKRLLSRTSSALTFSSDSRSLYVADKTGDCYEFDCQNLDKPGKWILGHLSMVLDVLATSDNR